MPIDNSTRFPKPLAADLRELSEGMAIVIDGDTAPKAISSGQYLFIKNHSTLATGGYHATAAIASGADITSSNVTPDADGIVNGAFSSLSEHMGYYSNVGSGANIVNILRCGKLRILTCKVCTFSILKGFTLDADDRPQYAVEASCIRIANNGYATLAIVSLSTSGVFGGVKFDEYNTYKTSNAIGDSDQVLGFTLAYTVA